MEEQIANLSDKGVILTSNMAYMAVFISFIIQFVKAALMRWKFFEDEGVKKSFFPMLSCGLTMGTYYFVGVQDWALAGVAMGLAACGGYQAFAGSAKLIKPLVPNGAGILLLCAMLIVGGCATFQSNPKAEYVASAKTFALLVDSITAMKSQLSEEEQEQVGALIDLGGKYFETWQTNVKAGIARPDIITLIDEVVNKLIQIKTNIERKSP